MSALHWGQVRTEVISNLGKRMIFCLQTIGYDGVYYTKQSGMPQAEGLWGQEPPKNSMSPQSAQEFYKIAMQCRHFQQLIVMILASVVTFHTNLKAVAPQKIQSAL